MTGCGSDRMQGLCRRTVAQPFQTRISLSSEFRHCAHSQGGPGKIKLDNLSPKSSESPASWSCHFFMPYLAGGPPSRSSVSLKVPGVKPVCLWSILCCGQLLLEAWSGWCALSSCPLTTRCASLISVPQIPTQGPSTHPSSQSVLLGSS